MSLRTVRNDSITRNRQATGNKIPVGSRENLSSDCSREREIKRYGAYFKGWCQAFGEHENILLNDKEGSWLLGENQVGMVLSKALLRQLNHEVLLHEHIPTLTFGQQGVHIGVFRFPFKGELEKRVLGAIEQLLETDAALHLFLTSHLLYGNGSRIMTIASRRPQPIIYREIGSMNIKLL